MPTSETVTPRDYAAAGSTPDANNVVPLHPAAVREPPVPAVPPQKAKERIADDSPEKVADSLGDVA